MNNDNYSENRKKRLVSCGFRYFIHFSGDRACIKDYVFIEPACGNGNFLVEILTRKLATVKRLYKSNPYDFDRYSVLAVTSVYGVDIMQDNTEECRNRLYSIWEKEYKAVCKKQCNDDTRKSVKYILQKNILCGNALTLMCVDEQQKDTDIPIVFPEWSMVLGTKLKRRDFRLDVLLKVNENQKIKTTIAVQFRRYKSVLI